MYKLAFSNSNAVNILIILFLKNLGFFLCFYTKIQLFIKVNYFIVCLGFLGQIYTFDSFPVPN